MSLQVAFTTNWMQHHQHIAIFQQTKRYITIYIQKILISPCFTAPNLPTGKLCNHTHPRQIYNITITKHETTTKLAEISSLLSMILTLATLAGTIKLKKKSSPVCQQTNRLHNMQVHDIVLKANET
jgi:hypothetical protein